MNRIHGNARGLVISSLLLAVPAFSQTPDSAAIELADGNHTQVARIGVQWDWPTKWWQSNGTHLGGYWDFDLAQWRAQRFQNLPGARQNLTEIGLTPVFRFQRDDKMGWYAELGIGIHYLSGIYNNNGKQLSTHFQFGDHVGIGYAFHNGIDLGLRLQHFSNGGYHEPNDGINFVVLRARYRF